MNIFGCHEGGFWQIVERFQNSKDINQIRTACLHCLYVLGLVTHIYRRFEKSGCAEIAHNVGSSLPGWKNTMKKGGRESRNIR